MGMTDYSPAQHDAAFGSPRMSRHQCDICGDQLSQAAWDGLHDHGKCCSCDRHYCATCVEDGLRRQCERCDNQPCPNCSRRCSACDEIVCEFCCRAQRRNQGGGTDYLCESCMCARRETSIAIAAVLEEVAENIRSGGHLADWTDELADVLRKFVEAATKDGGLDIVLPEVLADRSAA